MIRTPILSATIVLVAFGIANAQRLPSWVIGEDSGEGVSAMVELVKLAGDAAGAFFGYRCFNAPNRAALGNGAYFLKIDNTDIACMKDPVTNITVTIDGKAYPQTYRCDDKALALGGQGSLYFEWGENSRADLNSMYEFSRAIDKSKSKEMIISVTDKNHYLFRGSLRNASLRKTVKCPINR